METQQQSGLFDSAPVDINISAAFPATRYQGSKYKMLRWIDHCTRDLQFDSVLDAFGGTACVGYMFKKRGKQVFYNDCLKFNYYIGLALIENTKAVLDDSDVEFILKRQAGVKYPTFIHDTFHDIYFTNEENKWLDVVVTNISAMDDKHKQALAYYALCQACIIKRPFNLFHRKNLYIRTAEVKRSFGNKKTWDTPFEHHFRKFVNEGNRAVFDNGRKNQVFHADIFDLNIEKDLVYIDTPYISKDGIGVNYRDFYHFLEGIVCYNQWPELIDRTSKHKKIKTTNNAWHDKNKIHQAFEKLFNKFKNSMLVVSYRDNGIPQIRELVAMLRGYKKTIDVKKFDYHYVLSKRACKEVLIIAR